MGKLGLCGIFFHKYWCFIKQKVRVDFNNIMEKIRRVILIDDDEVRCFINKYILEDLDIAEQIECLYNGEQALQYLKENYSSGTTQQNKPDLFFLDLNMPIMNGFEFLEEFKNLEILNKSRLKIIILTSSANLQDSRKIESFRDTVHCYLTKPLKKENVMEVVETIK